MDLLLTLSDSPYNLKYMKVSMKCCNCSFAFRSINLLFCFLNLNSLTYRFQILFLHYLSMYYYLQSLTNAYSTKHLFLQYPTRWDLDIHKHRQQTPLDFRHFFHFLLMSFLKKSQYLIFLNDQYHKFVNETLHNYFWNHHRHCCCHERFFFTQFI